MTDTARLQETGQAVLEWAQRMQDEREAYAARCAELQRQLTLTQVQVAKLSVLLDARGHDPLCERKMARALLGKPERSCDCALADDLDRL